MDLPAPRILREDVCRERGRSRSWQIFRERIVFVLLGGAAVFSVLVTAAIIGVLGKETLHFFGMEEVTLGEFFGGTKWSPMLGAKKQFGIWPLVCGTLLVTGVAMLVAMPLGLVTAVYLSEYAPSRVRSVLKPILEILAGIPTVVYGFLGLTLITPSLKSWFDPMLDKDFQIYNAFAAGLMVGVLCLPIITSLCEDALRAVPQSLRDGAYGLGGTRFDVSLKVVAPAALSGIVSAFLLAIARAVGETMIVALVAGATPKMTLDPRDQVQTMTGFMVQMAQGDVSNFDISYYSLYAVGSVLFVMTFGITVIGNMIRRRFREVYQ